MILRLFLNSVSKLTKALRRKINFRYLHEQKNSAGATFPHHQTVFKQYSFRKLILG
jgi:hypothetical protein